jgi:hypothetical protein
VAVGEAQALAREEGQEGEEAPPEGPHPQGPGQGVGEGGEEVEGRAPEARPLVGLPRAPGLKEEVEPQGVDQDPGGPPGALPQSPKEKKGKGEIGQVEGRVLGGL